LSILNLCLKQGRASRKTAVAWRAEVSGKNRVEAENRPENLRMMTEASHSRQGMGLLHVLLLIFNPLINNGY
jgi:hypothetical protein